MKAASAVLFAGTMLFWSAAQAQDKAAAEGLIKKSGCGTCHAVSAKKDGPSYKSIAEKYKGKGADGEKAVQTQITGGGKDHPAIKTKDAKQIDNVVKYILSL